MRSPAKPAPMITIRCLLLLVIAIRLVFILPMRVIKLRLSRNTTSYPFIKYHAAPVRLSHLLAGIEPQEHPKITANGVVEIVRDQGKRPEAYFLLGGKRRICTKARKPSLIILFAAEPVPQCSISAGHPDSQLSAEAQLPDYLVTGTV